MSLISKIATSQQKSVLQVLKERCVSVVQPAFRTQFYIQASKRYSVINSGPYVEAVVLVWCNCWTMFEPRSNAAYKIKWRRNWDLQLPNVLYLLT